MVDNVAVTAGTGTSVATDDIAGVHYQRIKVTWGPDGTANDADVATGKPMPVQLRSATGTAITPITPDVGSGTGGSATQRMIIDSSQLDPTVAHDAADSGAPYKQGFKATTSLAGLTLVANADRTDGFAGIDGAQIVRPHCNLEDIVSGILANTDGASTAVIAAQAAGVKTYITTVIIANTSATAVTVDLRDGAAGSVKATFPVPANTSGVVCNLPVPLGFSAATAVCMDSSAAASTVTCTLIGFKSKV